MATEKRLIDANELVDTIYKSDEMVHSDEWETDEIVDQIDRIPTVDAVEVVRCCDCLHCTAFQKEADSEVILTCWCNSFEMVDPTDYCSRGERKDND